jgi:hypothetical protein
MKKIFKTLFKPLSLVGCPKCGQLKFKRIDNLDGSFYWKCLHCLYESNLNKKK